MGVDPTDFVLTTTGSISGANVSSISGGSSIYTVNITTGSGDGTVRLDVLNDGSIMAAGAALVGGAFTAGESYTIIKNFLFVTMTPTLLPPPPPPLRQHVTT